MTAVALNRPQAGSYLAESSWGMERPHDRPFQFQGRLFDEGGRGFSEITFGILHDPVCRDKTIAAARDDFSGRRGDEIFTGAVGPRRIRTLVAAGEELLQPSTVDFSGEERTVEAHAGI